MTEQEVIEYLKENKNKGIALLFVPEDVLDWINNNYSNPKLLYLAPNGRWEKFSETDFDDYDNVVFALPDYYELPQKPSGEWVEFEIDQRGNFHCFKDNDMHYFFWTNWGIFLKAFSDEYTAFGGWKFKDCEAWYITPQVFLDDHHVIVTFKGEGNSVKPAIPCKIRFWREAK